MLISGKLALGGSAEPLLALELEVVRPLKPVSGPGGGIAGTRRRPARSTVGVLLPGVGGCGLAGEVGEWLSADVDQDALDGPAGEWPG